jgi:hypothetical protein
VNLEIEFEAITMTCGHTTALPQDTVTERRQDHRNMWCGTCGHKNHFPQKSKIEKERAKTARAERLMKDREEERDSARDAASHADHRARGYKGHLTRQRKRSVAGACPCCNRTFQQLARHMKSKHPQYEVSEDPPPQSSVKNRH